VSELKTPTVVVRHALVLTDGIEFVRGDVVAIVTRTGSDKEAGDILAESLRDETWLTGIASFQLLGRGVDPLVRPTVTIVTARANDPDLHEFLARDWGALTAVQVLTLLRLASEVDGA
jgi:hypothetical protein